MNTLPSFWDLIGGICIINLDHRTDRLHAIMKQLQHVPKEKIQRISAVWGKELPAFGKGPYFRNCNKEERLFWAGRAGCLLSHRKCIQYALDHQWENVLILEDDATFHDDLEGDIGHLLSDVIQSSQAWQMFFLGSTPYYPKAATIKQLKTDKGEVTVARIMGPLCAHCYLVHKSAYNSMLQVLPTEKNVWSWQATHLSYDSWIANEFGRTDKNIILGCYPNLCSQGLFYSDIEHHDIQHGMGALGCEPWPVDLVDEQTFLSYYRQPKFIFKKWMKLAAHAALGIYYRICGYRKFSVSIESAGYLGALKAAIQVMKKRS